MHQSIRLIFLELKRIKKKMIFFIGTNKLFLSGYHHNELASDFIGGEMKQYFR
jgi:hypothetical protein